jgi:ABC-type multidrug transport system ATPase subunit
MTLTANLPAVFKGRSQILHPTEIVVPAGQVLGVIGPNGAGKSTLLRSLAGIDRLHADWNGVPLPGTKSAICLKAFR